MGSYITQEMLEDRVQQKLIAGFLKYDCGTDNYISALNDIILRAESRVNGYLASIYTVPVPTSGFVEEFALSIAEYELYRRGSGGSIPEKIKDSYESTLKDLRLIANGTIELGGTTSPLPSSEVTGLEIVAAEGIFDAESMEDAGW